jgi:hypothetical protein
MAGWVLGKNCDYSHKSISQEINGNSLKYVVNLVSFSTFSFSHLGYVVMANGQRTP